VDARPLSQATPVQRPSEATSEHNTEEHRMSLRIFETDPDARPKKRTSNYDTPDFRLKGGIQVNGQPQALSTWAFTTDENKTAEYLSNTFGGEIEVLDNEKGDDLQIVSESASVDV